MIRTKCIFSEHAMELVNRKRSGVHRMTVEEAVEVWRHEGDPNRCVLELQRIMGKP